MRFALPAFALTALLTLSAAAMPLQTNGEPVSPPPLMMMVHDQVFNPSEINLAAGKKVTLYIKNQDSMAAEFKSPDLRAGKIIPAHAMTSITLGPLTAGTYTFYNDFDPAKGKGAIIVK